MTRMLINATQPDEVRVAITDNSLLVGLDIEYPGLEEKKGNVYKGRISSVEPSLGAVFVDYGSERHGFLPIKEISEQYYLDQKEAQRDNPDIHRMLKVGQELIVQVEKEERGTKGAALSTYITLAGSYLVLMPNNPRAGGISRRIDGDDRDNLRETLSEITIPGDMGVIIRTAGVGRSKEELQWDLSVLLQYWEAIQQASESRGAPYLIHQESDVMIRAIRDNLRHDISEVIIDDASCYERAKAYITQVRPNFSERVKLYQDHLPLFSRFQIEQQIESAYEHEVRLPSGGSVVIDTTEALVSIDINSSRATKGSDIEETALNTNLEAADEIARQLRLRDIGGLIVIDFIDMTPSRNQREVENRLRDALAMDRARIQIGRISRFGLLEMSRQRLRSSLNRASQVTCPRCSGQGTIRSVESLALSITHLIQEKAATAKNLHLQVQVPIDIATFLLNEKRAILKEIELHAGLRVTIIPNENLQSPQYIIKQTYFEESAIASREVPSYKLSKTPKAESLPTSKKATATSAAPAVTEFLDQSSIPQKPAASSGFMQKLRGILFGCDTKETKASAPHQPTTQAGARPAEGRQRGNRNQPRRAPRKNQPRENEQQADHAPRDRRGGNRSGGRRRSNEQSRRGGRGERPQAQESADQKGDNAPEQDQPKNQHPPTQHAEQRPANPPRDEQPKDQGATAPKQELPVREVVKAESAAKTNQAPSPVATAQAEAPKKPEAPKKQVFMAPASAYQAPASESNKTLKQVTTKSKQRNEDGDKSKASE